MKLARYVKLCTLGWLGIVISFKGPSNFYSCSKTRAAFLRATTSRMMCLPRSSTVGALGATSANVANLAEKTTEPESDPYEVEAKLVDEDKSIYLGLVALQLLPYLFIDYTYSSFVYLGILAVTTVYLGSKRQDIPNERTQVTTRQALTAPVLSSVSLFGIFLVLKYTDVSFGVAYQTLTTVLGVGSAVSIIPPVLRATLPEAITSIPVSAPLEKALAGATTFFKNTGGIDKEVKDDQPLLDFAELAVLLTAVIAALIYVDPEVGLSAKFLVPNILAWCIAMQTIGVISIMSFTTAVTLLAGLFCYDIFWVFGTEVMMTVATRIEAPVKFLFPSPPDLVKPYPFSVLGLGDIVIPATFCTLMRSFDQHLAGIRQAEAEAARALAEKVSQKNPVALWLDSILGVKDEFAEEGPTRLAGLKSARGEGAGVVEASTPAEAGEASGRQLSYFETSVAAYALGLGLCFAVNFLSKSGQPALLYLNPMLLGSAAVTAALNGNGQLEQLFSYSKPNGRPNPSEDGQT